MRLVLDQFDHDAMVDDPTVVDPPRVFFRVDENSQRQRALRAAQVLSSTLTRGDLERMAHHVRSEFRNAVKAHGPWVDLGFLASLAVASVSSKGVHHEVRLRLETTYEKELDLLRVAYMDDDTLVELICGASYSPPGAETLLERIRGYDAAERAKDRGRGVIGVTLHMGNYELGAQVLPELVSPVAIAYNRDPWGLFEKLRSRARRASQVEEIPINGSPFFTVEGRNVLKRKGLLLAAADRGLPTERGPYYTFLGAKARFLDWPARLSFATGAPLLPCAVVLRPDEGYTIELAEPIDPADFADPQALMQRAVESLEDFVRRFPEQWLILHRYWDRQPEEEAHAAAA